MSLFVWGRTLSPGSAPASAHASAALQLLPEGSRPHAVACGTAHTLVVDTGGAVRQLSPVSRTPWSRLYGSLRGLRAAAVAAGAQHSAVVCRDGSLHEMGALFVAERREAGGGATHALAGMGHLDRNEYLRKIVQRSEAAYLAARSIAEISTEGEGSGARARTGADAAAPVDGDSLDAAEILRTQVRRVWQASPQRAALPAGVLIRFVACGYAHTVAGDAAGALWAVGYCDRGQLGTGDRRASSTYKRVALPPGVTVARVACGQAHTLAATTDGGCLSWGSGVLGQLGLGGSGDRLLPTPVAGLAGVTAVASGANHCLALVGGRVHAWGHSEYSQMVGVVPSEAGDLGTAARFFYVPRAVAALENVDVHDIAAGGNFSAALLTTGQVVTWGWNAFYCLGRGSGDRYLPDFAFVVGLAGARATSIACGYNTAAAVTAARGDPHAAGLLALLAASADNAELSLLARPPAPVRAGTATGREGLAAEQLLELAARTAERLGTAGAAATARLRARLVGGDDVEDEVEVAEEAADDADSESPAEDTVDGETPLSGASVPQTDLLFLAADEPTLVATSGTAAVAAAAANNGVYRESHARPAPATASAGSSFNEARAQLEKALLLLAAPLSRPSHVQAQAHASPAIAHGADAGSAAAARRGVSAHAAIIASRCAVLGEALTAARAAPGTAIAVAHDVASCTWLPGEARWRVTFGSAAAAASQRLPRIVLAALAVYLYGDDLLAALPPHRLPALAALAAALSLPRLVALCDAAAVRSREAAASLVSGVEAAAGLRESAAGNSADALAHVPLPSQSTFAADLATLCPRLGAPPPPYADVEVRVRCTPRVNATAGVGGDGAAVMGAAGDDSAVFVAHRIILCRAAYFRAVFYAFPVGGPPPAVTLEDTEPAVFAALLVALYTGDIAPASRPDVALPALALAARLCLTDIMQRLQDAVCDDATPEDAPLLADFAEAHGLPQLARAAASLSATVAARATRV